MPYSTGGDLADKFEVDSIGECSICLKVEMRTREGQKPRR
jgi:hypothetical protein